MTPELLESATLGREARDFLNSPLGSYLIAQVDRTIEEAQDSLSKVSPWRRRRITALQNEIWRAKSVLGWIAQAIQEGQAAEAALIEENAER
jgi:hypothetical protein